MAKGDDAAVRNQIGSNNQTMAGYANPYMGTALGGYQGSAGYNQADYQDIMNRYRDIAGGAPGTGGNSGWATPADQFKSYAGYEDFAKTGGFSRDDIANMRARGVAPIRAVYGNAERELNRNRALQGGYSPNFAAAQAKMAREQSQGQADALQNTEAGLAEMVQKGKQFGLQGMTPIEQYRMQLAAQSAASGAAASNANNADRFRALAGMTSLYGTTPGMAEMFGRQALGGMGTYGDYLNNSVRGQIQGGMMPGTFDTTMDRIGQIGDMAGGMIYPWLS